MLLKALFTSLLLTSFSFGQDVIGQATQLKSKTKTYTELRTTTQGRDYTSQYKDPQGRVFATKEVQYPSNRPWGPEFKLKDTRSGFEIEVKGSGNSVQVIMLKEGKRTQKRIQVKPTHIWDSGIHYFIIDNWDILTQTQTREVFIPELARFIEFEFKRNSSNLVEMKIASTLLSWFVDPIYIQYTANKTMIKYSGVSDISDAKGKQLEVQIDYSYPK